MEKIILALIIKITLLSNRKEIQYVIKSVFATMKISILTLKINHY